MSNNSQKVIVRLMERGATLLSESCPRCGGLQVSYKGRVICPKDDNITGVEQLETPARTAKSTGILYNMILERAEGLLKKTPGAKTSELELSEIMLNYARSLAYIRGLEKGKSDESSVG